jgi:hypothetical protein
MWISASVSPLAFPQQNLKLKWEGRGGRRDNPKDSPDKVGLGGFFLSFIFTYKQKWHNNKPKQRLSLLLPSQDGLAGAGNLQAGRRLKLCSLARSRRSLGTASLLTQRNKGVMIHDQQHAKVKQENGTK